MTRILMVRHGRAAASYTDDTDPGLDDLGQRQARTVAEKLAPALPLVILSSPLRRAQETAMPLAEMAASDIRIEPRVSEIPSPGLSLEARGPWLRQVMGGLWSEQSDALQRWREELVQCLIDQQQDCVIFSHFVAINVVTGFAENRDEVTLFRPDNASVTELTSDGSSLAIVSRGGEADTRVN